MLSQKSCNLANFTIMSKNGKTAYFLPFLWVTFFYKLLQCNSEIGGKFRVLNTLTKVLHKNFVGL
jgi:hypothetical protein